MPMTNEPDEPDKPGSDDAAHTAHTESPAEQRRRSRRGAQIVALVVLLFLVIGGVTSYVLTRTASDQADEPALTTVAAPETGAVAGEDFAAAEEGDCLFWEAGDARDLSRVDCSDEHRFEVAAVIDLAQFPGSEWGPEAEFPTELRFAELRTQLCEPAVADYLGESWDPRGKFSVNLINPGEAGWSAGERTIRCGLQNVGTTGQVFPVQGHVADQEQAVLWEPGTCIGINHDIPTDPVSCDDPHAFEVVGIVNLEEEFGEGHPSTEDQDRFLDGRCREIAAEYVGSPERLEELRLTAFWDTRTLSSWLAGSRSVNCAVGAQTEGAGFATIVGGVREDITINGQPPGEPAEDDGEETPN